MVAKNRVEDRRNFPDMDVEKEDECGICLEPCPKMVVPSCCHAMCINCYHDWNTRSESCPFCQRSLKRVNSGDLWVSPAITMWLTLIPCVKRGNVAVLRLHDWSAKGYPRCAFS